MERQEPGGLEPLIASAPPFRSRFVEVFGAHFPKVFRYLTRISDDPELAADLAQEVFLRLYRRGSMPDDPEAWIITVAINLFRNERAKTGRRRVRLSRSRAERVQSDPTPSPAELAWGCEAKADVRRALDGLPERDRQMLLLRAEGYPYREIASALDVPEASVGTLLARARGAFKEAYERVVHAR